MPTDPLTPTLTLTACYLTQQTEVIYRRGEQVIFQRIFHAFEYLHRQFVDKLLIRFCRAKGIRMNKDVKNTAYKKYSVK